jgi:threonine dehydrogenase-like Zn-dependent dehydrogenase
MVRICGRITGIGIPAASETPIPYKASMLKAIDWHFNMSSSYTAWDKALGMIERYADVLESIVTVCSDLEEWESVFSSMENETSIKPVFVF